MLGVLFSLSNPNLGLLVVLIALFFNQKGTREPVFKDANSIDRLLGKDRYIIKSSGAFPVVQKV